MTKLTKKQAYDLNRDIERMIDEKGNNPSDYSTDAKAMLLKYSGYGGLDTEGGEGTGILYEYYTPELIIRKMWELALKHGFQGGLCLEPSCGTGEFIRLQPHEKHLKKPLAFVAYETNKYSAAITKILYGSHTEVRNAPFETHFIRKNESVRAKIRPEFDIVIGNPPYGSIKGGVGGKYWAMGEDTYSKAQNYDEYFTLRGLDVLKTGGLLSYIVGAEVANNAKTFLMRGESKVKDMIAERAELVEAYRLPNGVFDRTDVLSDIIILRKK